MQSSQYPTYESYKPSSISRVKSIPCRWKEKPLAALCGLRSVRNRPDEELLSVYLGRGVIRFSDVDEKRTNATSLDLTNYQLVELGDFVLNNQQAWRGSVGVSAYRGIVSPAYLVLSLSEELDAEFANYLFRDGEMVAQYLIASKGVGTIQRNLYWPALKRAAVSYPPKDEQKAIAGFLDEKLRKIDQAITIKEQQIALLKERRQIIIQEAVSKGLNPDAPMKDSGVDWIGAIPEHWEQRPNKHIFRQKKNTVGKRSSDYDLLSLTLRGIIKRDMENPEGKFPAEFDTYQEVRPGDFVFCHFDVEETPRTVGLSEFSGMITGAYTVYEASGDIDPRFLLHFYIFADTGKKMRGLYKGLRNTIPKDAFGAFKTPLPPIDEQQNIVNHIDVASKRIAEGITIKEQQIAALKEYKTSLINEAVTGKIKVA
jgi:type I restriction enzyme, S subunit